MSSALSVRPARRFLILVCCLAFGVRLSAIFLVSNFHVVDDDTNHFGFGWEMGRVASSLAEGHGFSSPLPLPTGPTAMVGPAYPLLLAVVFKIFGIYTANSGFVIRILQSVFSSLTCWFIYLSGRDSLGHSAGKLAAVAWAVFPLNIFFTIDRVWETSLTSMLMAALFWGLLRTRNSLSTFDWAFMGASLGLAALISTSLVVIAVPFGLRAIWKNRLRFFLPAVANLLAFLAVVSPWLIRNYLVFHRVMVRSNFPLEFRVANNVWSYGQKVEALHPSNNPSVNRHWQQVGEMHFMDEERAANAAYVSAHFDRFSFAVVNRVVNYWTGAWIKTLPEDRNSWPIIISTSVLTLFGLIGIGRMLLAGNHLAGFYCGCLFIYPLTYYASTSQPRFYHAVTPLLILAGSSFLQDLWLGIARYLPAGLATQKANCVQLEAGSGRATGAS